MCMCTIQVLINSCIMWHDMNLNFLVLYCRKVIPLCESKFFAIICNSVSVCVINIANQLGITLVIIYTQVLLQVSLNI